jgi:hypothetical protein
MADMAARDTIDRLLRSQDRLREVADRTVTTIYRLDQYAQRAAEALSRLQVGDRVTSGDSISILLNESISNLINNIVNSSNVISTSIHNSISSLSITVSNLVGELIATLTVQLVHITTLLSQLEKEPTDKEKQLDENSKLWSIISGAAAIFSIIFGDKISNWIKWPKNGKGGSPPKNSAGGMGGGSEPPLDPNSISDRMSRKKTYQKGRLGRWFSTIINLFDFFGDSGSIDDKTRSKVPSNKSSDQKSSIGSSTRSSGNQSNREHPAENKLGEKTQTKTPPVEQQSSAVPSKKWYSWLFTIYKKGLWTLPIDFAFRSYNDIFNNDGIIAMDNNPALDNELVNKAGSAKLTTMESASATLAKATTTFSGPELVLYPIGSQQFIPHGNPLNEMATREDPSNLTGPSYNISVEGVQLNMPKEEIDEESLARKIGWEIVSKMKLAMDNRVAT